jgi:murein DD-endopeptidase MepM/ murein hydrolase activator NlpD
MGNLLLSFLLLLVAIPAHAQTNESVQTRIEESNAQIAKLQKEIEQLTGELNATSQQKQTLQNTVTGFNLNIQKTTKSISLTNTEIGKKDKEIHTLSGNISTTASKMDLVRGQIAGSLRQLDMLDQEPVALVLFGGGTLSSFFDQATSLAALRQALHDKSLELSDLKGNLTVSKSSAEQKRADLANLQRQLAQQQKTLAIARDEQNTLLQQTKSKEANYQTLIAQKKAEQAVFEAELYRLAASLGTADTSAAPSPSRGILNWPLGSVTITQQFGGTVDARRLYTSGTHNGVDFRASIGTPVRAALGGTVQEINQGAVKNCQYGKWALVKHDNGLTTLYAHLSSIAVVKGQRVATGETLGYSGDTGYATGPHLHFTVYASSAVQFKNYTCNSGYTAYIPYAAPNAYLDPMSYLPGL